MKRWNLYAILVCGFFWMQQVSAAEVIQDFSVTATLNRHRQLVIEESIQYDFGETERHGIYRSIPMTYRRSGGTYRLRLSIEEVTRDGVREAYEMKEEHGRLTIKIGSAQRIVTGLQTYRIRYATDRAINFFDDGHSELYWNVTGNEWPIAIERASFTLSPPAGTAPAAVSSTCFIGTFGSTEQACQITPTTGGFSVTSKRILLPDEGLTVAFAFPRGIILAPTLRERVWQLLIDNGILFFPLAALLLMHWMWWTKGRDPKRMTVVPEYDPPRMLSPAVIGSAITNGDVPPKVVTATILDLARRGFLTIRFGEEKQLIGKKQLFTFVKHGVWNMEHGASIESSEADILHGLFAGGDVQTIEDLKQNEFYEHTQRFTERVAKEIDRLKIFVSNPNTVRGAYFAIAFVVGFFLAMAFSTPLAFGAAIATGSIIVLYGWFMPRRTLNGVKLLAEIEGFKWFLSVTEKDRLAFTDAPERTPEQFQRLLPYAVALGVEEQWAKQFASLAMPPPSWAEGNLMAFNALWLVSSLGTMHDSAKSAAYAAPSQAGSGGSGFSGGGSGGGGGGGGGGSW